MEEQSVSKKRKLKPIEITVIAIIIAPLFLLLFLVIGVLIDTVTDSTAPATVTQQEQTEPAFKILSYNMKNEEYTKYVTGRIQNNTNKTFGYVQVEINLYDINNNFLGSTLDNVNNFEPGAVWNFKAIVIDDNAKKFKIMDIKWRE
jgi:hypothetical protein